MAYKTSEMTLDKVIYKVVNFHVGFLDLEYYDQINVLSYIRDKKLDINVYGKRWYDILTKKFYIEQYTLREPNFNILKNETFQFDTFKDFYNFARGDIYEYCCYFGYQFSLSEKRELGIFTSLLNNDSFIDKNIDNYTFEFINDERKIYLKEKVKQANNIDKLVTNCKKISSLSDLEKQVIKFNEKFAFLFTESRDVFFSLIVRKNKDLVKDAAIEYACRHTSSEGFTFEDVLLIYGKDAAYYVIENYSPDYSPNTTRRYKKQYLDFFGMYCSDALTLKRVIGYDDSIGLYYVHDRYHNNINYILSHKEYFCSFEDFVSYLDHDIRGADLSSAPISNDDVICCMMDSTTKLPKAQGYANYEVIKKYLDGEFIVIQKWTNSDKETVLSKKHKFSHFFDFVHFLKGDLSNADLLFCEGVENIKYIDGLVLDGLMVRSEIAEKLKLPLNIIPKNRFKTESFNVVKGYEVATTDTFMTNHFEDDDAQGKVSYISDIHLLHRFDAYKCRTFEDAKYVIKIIAENIADEATSVNLIAGDTSSDIKVFKNFIQNLKNYRRFGCFFFTLGNHELWAFNNKSLEEIIEEYRSILNNSGENHMFLVQNNLYYLDNDWVEIGEKELGSISPIELRNKTKSARAIIFGGIGFSGLNEEFNANNKIYMDVLDRKAEVIESEKFLSLYEKVTNTLNDRNLIVLTHMPIKDWAGIHNQAKERVVYINGHNHRNYYHDDGKIRIYADNQVGYSGKRLSLKKVSYDFGYDWFAEYEDGIYTITKEDYMKFYRGIGETVTFNRDFKSLFLIKRCKTYMFLMETPKGYLSLMNGGSIRKADKKDLNYYYENIVNYSNSVKLYLSKYSSFQKKVSKEIKELGGYGTIHGCIVDIDFYNHLYLNPLDGSITPYFAYNIIDKYVYNNLASLLYYKCPELYNKYLSLAKSDNGSTAIVPVQKNEISDKCLSEESTEMYRVSRIIKGLQYTTKYNVVRLWSRALIADVSEESGKLIVSTIINPDLLPPIIKEPKVLKPKVENKKSILTEEEKALIRAEQHCAKILNMTEGKIVCLSYRGSKNKSDYQCSICGYTWSCRSDHLKDKYKYRCPKCYDKLLN